MNRKRDILQEKMVIWGASGHAMVVADIIKIVGEFELVGFLDDINPDRQNKLFCGYPIFGGKEQLDNLRSIGVSHIIFGFGHCEKRLELSELVRSRGFTLVSAIHPKAVIAENVSIGRGTVVVAGVIVNPGAIIGENVIINTSSSVDHECIIDDGVHICPGVHLAGKVTVGRASWIGVGAVVSNNVRIGAGTTIGAGAVVTEDIPDGVLAFGTPAKIVNQI